ncbi:glutathione S-transferase protein [Necator americanus]|uniref:Glutathione S-transferase omega n=1 Tax=Necator americanus TaxID=51031 RepID=W2TWD3_NECAM|nr:glutathione S-transferase protein [Necator americanus]ETN86380.1 glutathione S-transferase protein [Necator americanus]
MYEVRVRNALLLCLLPLVVSSEIVGDELKPASLSLRLYVMRFCPWCERVLLYLSRKNLSVEIVNVNLVEKPQFLLQKHPEGKVPVLEHNGKTIIDSALISEYLDWIHPHTSILPSNPYLRAKQRMIASLLEAKLPAAVRAIVEEQKRTSQKPTTTKMLHDALDTAERLLNSSYFSGDDAGFADYMTYPFLERIWIWSHEPGATDLQSDAFPSHVYPKLQQWFANMMRRKEVARIRQPLWRHQLFNRGYIKGKPDFDAGMSPSNHY